MNLAKPAPKIPILIVISYWDGDRDLARQMAALMADLQPHHVGRAAEVLIVCRQDSMIDQSIVEKLKTRFTVRTRVAGSPLRGWPGGCNGMFGSACIHISQSLNAYDCFFWMEADCVPMYCNWFADLHGEWVRRPKGTHIVGCKADANGDGSGWHITGCALYDCSISRIIPGLTTCTRQAWDWQFKHKIIEVGHHTNAIALKYKTTEPDAAMVESHYTVVHGWKNNWLINAVRAKRNV